MANLKELPESLAVIGGGVISVEYATVFAALGLPTFLLCRKEAFLPFLPKELQGAIKADMARNGIQIIHNPVSRFEVGDDKMVRRRKKGMPEEWDGGRQGANTSFRPAFSHPSLLPSLPPFRCALNLRTSPLWKAKV
jgi:NADPH-dependent 2,4-dienoyl-CoA reductase/sulfur reductase-like enzyme